MDELQSLKDRMEQERPTPWKDLPDIALYMDQLISYMPRQLIPTETAGDPLTAAMVNNYIKAGLLPRAEGKRYDRRHLAYLTAICALKPVLSMKELAQLLGAVDAQHVVAEDWYGFFLGKLDESMGTVADSLDENFKKSAANIENIDALPTIGLNVLDILKHEKLVLTADAVKAVEARLA